MNLRSKYHMPNHFVIGADPDATRPTRRLRKPNLVLLARRIFMRAILPLVSRRYSDY